MNTFYIIDLSYIYIYIYIYIYYSIAMLYHAYVPSVIIHILYLACVCIRLYYIA